MANRNYLTEIKKGHTGTGLLIENDGFVSLDGVENKSIRESIDSFKNGDLIELPRPFVVSAVFQKYGIENANGRIYPENVLKREVEKYQKNISERTAYGELNHPQESAIDLGRIAMNIVELHWVGHTLVGKMEIPITEGFRKYGIVSTRADEVAQLLISNLKIGVSSRGLGTVEQQMGKLIVSSDYEILCWDVVSGPSTPNAWIDLDEKKLEPYIESKTNNNKKVVNEDKFSKFDNWLTD